MVDLTILAMNSLDKSIYGKISSSISKALFSLTGIPVHAKVVDPQNLDMSTVIQKYSNNRPVAAVVASILYKEVQGYIIILFELSSARDIVKVLSRLVGFELNNSNAHDILRELGNIIIGNIVSALSDETGITIEYEIPEVIIDLDTALIQNIVLVLGYKNEKIQTFELQLYSHSGQIGLKVLMMGIGHDKIN